MSDGKPMTYISGFENPSAISIGIDLVEVTQTNERSTGHVLGKNQLMAPVIPEKTNASEPEVGTQQDNH
jgi:hypothetical protein